MQKAHTPDSHTGKTNRRPMPSCATDVVHGSGRWLSTNWERQRVGMVLRRGRGDARLRLSNGQKCWCNKNGAQDKMTAFRKHIPPSGQVHTTRKWFSQRKH